MMKMADCSFLVRASIILIFPSLAGSVYPPGFWNVRTLSRPEVACHFPEKYQRNVSFLFSGYLRVNFLLTTKWPKYR